MLTLLPRNYKSLICPKNAAHIWWYYYLNDRIAHFSIPVSTHNLNTVECRTMQKAKVGITPVSGNNSNFYCDIKRRT